MVTPAQQPQPEGREPKKLSDSGGILKADFGTIRLILLTAAVVLALLATPLIFILRNFVTFDALDKYLGVTQNVQPKILRNITEELDSGYSRDFFIHSAVSGEPPRTDNTMLFYATPGQGVSLIVQAADISGPFSPVRFQVDGCDVNRQLDDPSSLEFDLIKALPQGCSLGQSNLHTLRVVFPTGLLKESNMEVKCLVVVSQPVHQHVP